MTKEEKVALVEELFKTYESCQKLVKNYISTEVRPSDGYVVLAAHILWDLWAETGEDLYFWKAAVHLQAALQLSPASHDLKFILIKFYNKIGKITPIFYLNQDNKKIVRLICLSMDYPCSG